MTTPDLSRHPDRTIDDKFERLVAERDDLAGTLVETERERDRAESALADARHRLTAARLLVRRLLHMEREHLGSGPEGHLSERDLAPLLHALHIDPEETDRG